MSISRATNLSPSECAEKISHESQLDLIKVRQSFASLDLPKSIFIYATEEHGRLESPTNQPPFHAVIVDKESELEQAKEKIDHLFSSTLRLDAIIEWKTPSIKSLKYYSLIKTAAPSRFIHLFPLHGTKETIEPYLYRFVTEMQKMTSKERRKVRKKFFVNHRRQLDKTVDGTNTLGVDLKRGHIYYGDPKRQATKYSLLYPIQYALDLRIIDAIRVLGYWPKDLVKFLWQMPRSIPALIPYMHKEGLLPELNSQEVRKLQNAYSLGLCYLHAAQQKFSSEKKPIELSISDPSELHAAYADVQEALQKINSSTYCQQRKKLL